MNIEKKPNPPDPIRILDGEDYFSLLYGVPFDSLLSGGSYQHIETIQDKGYEGFDFGPSDPNNPEVKAAQRVEELFTKGVHAFAASHYTRTVRQIHVYGVKL